MSKAIGIYFKFWSVLKWTHTKHGQNHVTQVANFENS